MTAAANAKAKLERDVRTGVLRFNRLRRFLGKKPFNEQEVKRLRQLLKRKRRDLRLIEDIVTLVEGGA